MKRIFTHLSVLLFFFNIGIAQLLATHIVGSEISYRCINELNNTYRITLKMYRDCLAGQAPFDDPITLFIFDGATGQPTRFISIPRPSQTPQIQPEDWDPCVAIPPNICVEEGTYSTNVILPPRPGGYDIAWSRCCRNQAISNLANPLGEGISFLAHIPDPGEAACNNMPEFQNRPPIFLCKDEPFTFDHSAVDLDGDSLSYALTNPYTGLNFQGLGAGNPNQGGNSPVVTPLNNPMGPPPYNNVVFAPGYSFLDPLGSGDFSIDPVSGFFSVTPGQVGIFVFSISVFEWKNGKIISENRRDFQIHVLECKPQGEPPVIEHDLTGLEVVGDTIFVNALEDLCYDIRITDVNSDDQLTAFTASAAFGNGNFFPPIAQFNFNGINPIEGQICWQPSCSYKDQLVPLIIGARDINDCPNVGDVFDTVWVKVSIPPNLPPEITPDYSELTLDQDTIILTSAEELCFPFEVTDPNNDALDVFPVSTIFTGAGAAQIEVEPGSPVRGEICWTPSCDTTGAVIEVSFAARDMGTCSTLPPVVSTIYVKVLSPPNEPPTIVSDLSGNTLLGDTIVINALNEFRYRFNITDPDPADSLSMLPVSTVFGEANGPQIKQISSDPLQFEVSWEPACEYQDQIIPLIVSAADGGLCKNASTTQDTVYIWIQVPPNEAPQITADLSAALQFSNDTIFATADSVFCFDFGATDANLNDSLFVIATDPIFGIPNGPEVELNLSSRNPIGGQVCWTPSCDFVDQVIPLRLGVRDEALCNNSDTAYTTIFVAISAPPNEAPVITHDLSANVSIADTIFVNPEESLCYELEITDLDLLNTLTVTPLSPQFSTDTTISVSFSGTNPVRGTVCWTPSCEFQGQSIPLIIAAEDDADCSNQQRTLDTVYVKISTPLSQAPVVQSDLSGNTFKGDTVFIDVDEAFCYDFYVADRSPGSAVEYQYEFQTFSGTNIALGEVDIVRRNDSILGTVCFQSDCSNGGSLFRVVITGIDQIVCPPFPETKDTVFIKVNTDFESALGPDLDFCAGQGGIQLSATSSGATGSLSYTWGCTNEPDCGFSNRFTPNPIVNPSSSTTYFVQVTDEAGCSSEIDSIRINIAPLPQVDLGPDKSLCVGDSGVVLSARVLNESEIPGPYTYEWFPANGLDNPTLAEPLASPGSNTIYSVTVTAPNGCSSFSTAIDSVSTVEVKVSEKPLVEAGEDRNLCIGDSLNLLGFASGGVPDYSYSWFPDSSLSAENTQNPLAYPDSTTTYYLQAFAAGCPGNIDSMTVHVKPLPELEAVDTVSLCAGDSLVINVNALNDSLNRFTYQWTPAKDMLGSNSASPQIYPKFDSFYELVASSEFGCKNTPLSVYAQVKYTPIIRAGIDTFLCKGDTLRLSVEASFLGGDGISFPDSFALSWSPDTTLTTTSLLEVSLSPEQTTLYQIAANFEGCGSTDQLKVDVFETLSLALEADTTTLCQGDSTTLRAIGGTGTGVVSWEPAKGLVDASAYETKVSPEEDTWYSVRVSESGCAKEDSIFLRVNPSPEISFFTTATVGCAPWNVSFIDNSENTAFRLWDFGDGRDQAVGAVVDHLYTDPGEYVVTFTALSAFGCTATDSSTVVRVFPKGIASFTSTPPIGNSVSLPDAAIIFENLSLNAVSYQWDFGDGTQSTEFNPTHEYLETGTYFVSLVITDEAGCQDSISAGPYRVLIPELLIPNIFTPNDDGVNDSFRVTYTGSARFSMEIFDRWGTSVYETAGNPSQGWNGRYENGESAGTGVYYYTIRIGDQVFQGDLTLMR